MGLSPARATTDRAFEIDDRLFKIPAQYKEEPERMPIELLLASVASHY